MQFCFVKGKVYRMFKVDLLACFYKLANLKRDMNFRCIMVDNIATLRNLMKFRK